MLAPHRLLMILPLSIVLDGLILIVPQRSFAVHSAPSREFEQLVGGFGFGPSADLDRCPFACDPRLGSHCAQDDGPIPAGSQFCPRHACSVFPYSPLPATRAQSQE